MYNFLSAQNLITVCFLVSSGLMIEIQCNHISISKLKIPTIVIYRFDFNYMEIQILKLYSIAYKTDWK